MNVSNLKSGTRPLKTPEVERSHITFSYTGSEGWEGLVEKYEKVYYIECV